MSKELFRVQLAEIHDRPDPHFAPRIVAFFEDGTICPVDGRGPLNNGEYTIFHPEPEGEDIAITFSGPASQGITAETVI